MVYGPLTYEQHIETLYAQFKKDLERYVWFTRHDLAPVLECLNHLYETVYETARLNVPYQNLNSRA